MLRKITSLLFLFLLVFNFGFSWNIESVHEVCQLTGEESLNKTELAGIRGTDLGIMVEYKKWIFFLFGDTFNTRDIHDPKAFWKSNVMAYTTDTIAMDCIIFDNWIRDDMGLAKEMLSSKKKNKQEITVIPTAGLSLGERIWVAYMSVKEWGDPGRWICNYSGYACSDDAGSNFKKTGFRWNGNSNFVQLAFARELDTVFIYGTPAGRYGGVKLAKVNYNNFLEKKSYLYYMGQGTDGITQLWSEKENEAVEIISPPVGEMSVVWNEYIQRWIMTYLNEEKKAIVIRDSINPWGPWSNEKILIQGKGSYVGLYGGYLLPTYFEEKGKTIYFLISLYSQYNVCLMKAVLYR